MGRYIEILSPAGSYESLEAAVKAGADAVYIGGTRFGARAFADNLEEDMLLKAIDYAHLHNCKVYLTVNTLLKERELEELYSYLLPYYCHGLDAVIVQDIGVLAFIREQFPDLPIHASTQMTITNALGAKFLENLGVERVVTARELQLTEIREIADRTNLEIESFVHGALCYCYSGQCLYSSMIGGRSGNRGQCAQPCRLPYRVGNHENQYLLSLKDICTLEYIPELVEAGISSFKIEGRMKKPEYVALVTSMYRKYVDLYLDKGKEGFSVDPKDREKLMDLYNRGGSHSGYYFTKNGRDMLSLTRPNHAGVPALKVVQFHGKSITAKALTELRKGDVIELPGEDNYTLASNVSSGQMVQLTTVKSKQIGKGHIFNRTRNEALITEIRETILSRKPQETIEGELLLALHEPMELKLQYGEFCVTVTGDEPQEALSQPMDEERIRKQVCKTGNTPFVFGRLSVQMEDDIFVPMQAINELRRRGIEQLEKEVLSVYRRTKKERIVKERAVKCSNNEEVLFTVYVEEREQWKAAIESTLPTRIYVDCNAMYSILKNQDAVELLELSHQSGKEVFLAMPHIFRKASIEKYESAYPLLVDAKWDGVLVRNYESYEFLKKHQYPNKIVTDFNLYQFNQSAKEFWLKQDLERTTAPLELNYRELEEVGLEKSELVVYGYYPMMISAQCIQTTTDRCTHKCGRIVIKDRCHKEFIAKNQCEHCYNVIYNSAPTILLDQKEEICALKPLALRMQFTVEDYKKTKDMLALYEVVFLEDREPGQLAMEFTRGHFKRGIK